MLYITEEGVIRLTRGDTATISVSIENDTTGDAYSLEENDVLVLSVKKSFDDPAPCIQKRLTGTSTFSFSPIDTSSLHFGQYFYDVELTTSTGEVYTIVEPTCFEILKEVTC
jgi:predicted secreted protein